MKNYELLLFDLDGTLTDPGIGITNSVMHALNQFGIQVAHRSELYKFIGPPLSYSFAEYYGMDSKQTNQAIDFFHEYFTAGGMFENEVYPGINELLTQLRKDGYKLAIASSKPEIFVKKILLHFQLDNYFDFIGGAELEGEGSRFKKQDVIAYTLHNFPSVSKEQILMIGDREHDIIGAKMNGIDSVGVLYGYGSREEFEREKANFIVNSVSELRELLSK